MLPLRWQVDFLCVSEHNESDTMKTSAAKGKWLEVGNQLKTRLILFICDYFHFIGEYQFFSNLKWITFNQTPFFSSRFERTGLVIILLIFKEKISSNLISLLDSFSIRNVCNHPLEHLSLCFGRVPIQIHHHQRIKFTLSDWLDWNLKKRKLDFDNLRNLWRVIQVGRRDHVAWADGIVSECNVQALHILEVDSWMNWMMITL